MMIKECNQLTQQKHMHTKLINIEYVREKKLNVTM